MIPQFGKKRPGVDYPAWPSAYALVRDNDGRVLCVRAPSGLHLPGGALDPGEDGATAVVRELKEETGYDGRVLGLLGRANQYVVKRRTGLAVNKHAEFFEVAATPGGAPSDLDHAPVWLPLEQAAADLTHKFQRWAVSELLR